MDFVCAALRLDKASLPALFLLARQVALVKIIFWSRYHIRHSRKVLLSRSGVLLLYENRKCSSITPTKPYLTNNIRRDIIIIGIIPVVINVFKGGKIYEY